MIQKERWKIVASKLIELEEGILVEIEVPSNQVEQISGGAADRVNSTLNKIKPILINACKPVSSAWKELNKDMNIEKAEIELGLSFEGEGNIYITKTKAGANLTIKLILGPKNKEKADVDK